MTNVIVSSAARTAIGSYGKSLKDVPPTDLGAIASTAAIERAGIEPEQVAHVVFGNVIHTEPQDMYMARVVGMKSGLPKETPAFTVNRLCGTGVQAIVSAAQAIQSGDVGVALAGGAESMSRGPYWMPNARWGARMGETKMVDPVMGGLTDPFHDILMGVTAENLAERHAISREDQDAFAVESHRRAYEAREAGRFDDEVVPVAVRVKRETVEFRRDEHIRENVDAEQMAKLPAVFKKEGGTVTAGNASGINDGAAALVVVAREVATRLGARPLGRLVASASAGVHPDVMGLGPIPAVRALLERTGLTADRLDAIELNEAFAAQVIPCLRELGLPEDRTNPNGGAIAIGHPIAASGARLAGTLLRQLEREGGRYGVATMCIGVGQGLATLFEREPV